MKSFKSGVVLSLFIHTFVGYRLHALVIVLLIFHFILNQFCFLNTLQCDSKNEVVVIFIRTLANMYGGSTSKGALTCTESRVSG